MASLRTVTTAAKASTNGALRRSGWRNAGFARTRGKKGEGQAVKYGGVFNA